MRLSNTKKKLIEEAIKKNTARMVDYLQKPSPQPNTTTEQRQKVHRFFQDNPEADYCYLFYDGSIVTDSIYWKSRPGQLFDISSRGIPAIFYRSWYPSLVGKIRNA